MNKAYFEILRAGVNTTIQDKGRNHLYHVGIAVSGAIDQRNYVLSNKLVENELNAAVIEFAYQGPLLRLKNGKINFAISGDIFFKIIRKNLEVEDGECYKSYILGEEDQILELYFNKEYFCYMTGFIAGMPFLGDLNKNIRCDRLETPRLKMPKGSVGITEQFANIYTFESPGGWNIIGNTPKKIFDDKNLNQPALVNPGDKVSFYQITKEEYLNWNE